MKKPLGQRKPRSHSCQRRHAAPWAPYPVHAEPWKAGVHTECLFEALTDLAQISYDVTECLFGETKLSSSQLDQAAAAIYDSLRRWYKSLPYCIAHEQCPIPRALCIQYVFLCSVVIVIIIPFFACFQPGVSTDSA